MADIILTKANPGFNYCYQSNGGGVRALGQYEVATLKWNDEGTGVWCRSNGFTTGDYDVTNITVTVNNMSRRANAAGFPSVGIGTVIDDNVGYNDTPNVLWSEYDESNSVVNGHNQYSMTFNVDMKARTTYYLYLYTRANISTSNVAWQVFDHPNSSSDSSVSTVEITFNSKTVATPKYTLNLNAGTGISRVTGAGSYESGSYVTINAATTTGYNFKNWTNSSGSVVSNNASYSFYMPAATTTYTANGQKQTYLVQYQAGSYGSGTNTSTTKTYGTALTLSSSKFSRTGYDQTGWSINQDGSTFDYFMGDSYTRNEPITLYPYWSRNIYTLTINPNGGSMYNGANKTTSTFTTTFAYGVKTYLGNLFNDGGVLVAYNDNAPTRVGYSFTGFTFSNGSGQKNSAGAVYYFDGQSPEENSGESGASTSAYIFNGNYAGNVTVTANWTGNTYTVKYNANGGTGTTASSSHVYGTAKALTANGFTRTGYSFTGWNTAANGTGTSYSDKQSISTLTTGSEIELFAQWGQATYQVVFNTQGGIITSGNFDPKTYTIGAGYTLPTGTITKSGYVFLGWSKNSAATSATYSNGQSGTTDLGTTGTTVTLYAIWRAKKFTIKYNANNGTTTSSSTQYTATSSNTISALPSSWAKSGYIANGWSTSSTATSASYAFRQAFNDLENVADGGTLNLYVVWTKNVPWKLTLIKAKFNGVEYTL